MPDYNDALKEAERLSKMSDDRLLEELGLRAKDIERPGGEQRAQYFSGDFAVDAKDQGVGDFLLKAGRHSWADLQPKMMNLICDPNNADVRKLAGNKSIPQVAAGLATAAVAALIAAPPAWVIVAATLIASSLVESGLKGLCQAWAEEIKPPPQT